VIPGCNVENVAFGVTHCAERTAICSAIAQGYKPGHFKRIAVVGLTPDPLYPCGSCLQVLCEMAGKSLEVILTNTHGDVRVADISHLLPYGVKPDHLNLV
jgi:cytidine deaminase